MKLIIPKEKNVVLKNIRFPNKNQNSDLTANGVKFLLLVSRRKPRKEITTIIIASGRIPNDGNIQMD
ncbi:MAG: hypothetical protein NXI10_12820 [bacterium]|nr:hypothetical protein [bacterium]